MNRRTTADAAPAPELTPAKPTGPEVRIEHRREVIEAARSAVPNAGVLEVVYPPLGAWLFDARTGSDRHEVAPDGLTVAGHGVTFGRQTAGWIADLAAQHKAKLVVLGARAVKRAVEHGQTAEQIASLMATAGVAAIVDVSEVVPQPEPPAAVEPSNAPLPGEASNYARGMVRRVEPSQAHRISEAIEALDGSAVVLSLDPPDRITLTRQDRSQARTSHTIHRPERHVREWLDENLGSLAPALLVVEDEAAARAGLTLDDFEQLAREHRCAVALLPGRDDGRSTPQTIQKAQAS